jgi:hypothetical protein
MSTLVLLVAKQGTQNFPEDEDSANSLFGDLIKKAEAKKIIALRIDSSSEMPAGIAKLARSLGIESECVQVDKLDPSTWTGNVNPANIWSDHLETMTLNSPISPDDSELSFMLNSGSNFDAGLIHALYEVLGGSLWITERGTDQYTAIRLDRSIPDEGSAGEATLAGLASFGFDNPGSSPTATQLQGLIDGIPPGKGFENSLRRYKEYFEDDQLRLLELQKDLERATQAFEKEKAQLKENLRAAKKNKDTEGQKKLANKIAIHKRRIEDCRMALTEPKPWALNPLGRYNATLTLAQQWKPLAVNAGHRGLVIFVRSVKQSEWVVEYLKEHQAAIRFDKYAFVVGGINVTNEKEMSIRVHEKVKKHLGKSRVVSSPGEVCYSIPSNGGLREASVDVMEILHRIRQSNDGIEWSIDVTGVVGLLRPAVYQYSHLAGIPSFFIAKQYRGDGVYASGLTGLKHFLRLPDKSQIDSIGGVLNDEKLARFVATVYRSHRDNRNSEMGIEKRYGDNRPYDFNSVIFPTGHRLRMDDIPNVDSQFNPMKRHLQKAVDSRLVYLAGSDIHLTPEGIVAGALLND